MQKRFKTVSMMLFLMGAISGTAYAAPSSAVADDVRITQQNSACAGVVKDAMGEAIIGASVVVKGTTNGTITDFDGKFSIPGVKKGDVIQISFVGYKTQEVVWNGNALSIELKDDSQALEEVVVVGYGAVRKADFAGSVAVMDSKTFRDQPITQATDALQGRVAGVNVVSDGMPGGSVKIRIRGTNSINKSNEPLYVVDGMVRESGLDGINPEDISSMQILKDASSTAIYGSRGANGVIIVTTKSGKKGQTNMIVDASVGISNATNLPEMMSTKDYAKALVDYAGISQNDVADYFSGSNPGIDWVDLVFRTGMTQNYKMVFSKGREDVQTYISGNYTKTDGTIEKNSYERFAIRRTLNEICSGKKIHFKGLRWTENEIKNINSVHFIACGSAYHAGMVGAYACEELFRRKSSAEIASEFRYRSPHLDNNSLVIIISQSGETADTLAALRIAKEKGAKIISIVNVENS